MKNKYFKYDPNTRLFYTKDKNGTGLELGDISTRKGGLTRSDKLNLIKMNGEWVLL